MVELRKRKTPPPAPVRPAKKSQKKAAPKAKKEEPSVVEKAQAVVADAVETVKEAVASTVNGDSSETATAPTGTPKVGDTVSLADFGGEVETNEGTKTSLAKLVEQSKSGVVLFTYPKASTPGCKSIQSHPLIFLTNNRALQAPSKYASSATHTRP